MSSILRCDRIARNLSNTQFQECPAIPSAETRLLQLPQLCQGIQPDGPPDISKPHNFCLHTVKEDLLRLDPASHTTSAWMGSSRGFSVCQLPGISRVLKHVHLHVAGAADERRAEGG